MGHRDSLRSALAFNSNGLAFSLNWVGPGSCDSTGLGRNFVSRQLLMAKGALINGNDGRILVVEWLET